MCDQARAGPEGTISYMRKQLRSPQSSLLLHYLFSPILYLWPWGSSPLWWRTDRGRLRQAGLWMVLPNMQAPPKSGQLLPSPCLCDISEGHWWREILPGEITWASYLDWERNTWEEKWSDTPSDQGLEKVMIGKLVTKKSREEGCGQTSLNSWKTWRYLCLMWMFLKGRSHQRRILIIK